jgi:hypothetical protein
LPLESLIFVLFFCVQREEVKELEKEQGNGKREPRENMELEKENQERITETLQTSPSSPYPVSPSPDPATISTPL